MLAERLRQWIVDNGMTMSLYSVTGGIACPCMVSRDASHPSYSPEWHHGLNPLAEDCNGTGKISDYGTELAPALLAANWTCTNGWAASANQLVRTTNGSAGTATPSGAFSVLAAGVYRVSITVSAVTGSITWTIGGTSGTALSVGTLIQYLTATNTNKIIFTGAGGATCTITALSVKKIGTALSSPTPVSIKASIFPMSIMTQSWKYQKWLSGIGEIDKDDLYIVGAVKASDSSFIDLSSYVDEKTNWIVYNSKNYVIRDVNPVIYKDETVTMQGRLKRVN